MCSCLSICGPFRNCPRHMPHNISRDTRPRTRDILFRKPERRTTAVMQSKHRHNHNYRDRQPHTPQHTTIREENHYNNRCDHQPIPNTTHNHIHIHIHIHTHTLTHIYIHTHTIRFQNPPQVHMFLSKIPYRFPSHGVNLQKQCTTQRPRRLTGTKHGLHLQRPPPNQRPFHTHRHITTRDTKNTCTFYMHFATYIH